MKHAHGRRLVSACWTPDAEIWGPSPGLSLGTCCVLWWGTYLLHCLSLTLCIKISTGQQCIFFFQQLDIKCYEHQHPIPLIKNYSQMLDWLAIRLRFGCFFNQVTGQCFIYEPHFSQDDKIVVEEFGCSLIEHNEVG